MNAKNYFLKLSKQIDEIDFDQFDIGVELIKKTWKRGGQIITLGNGGSSLNALHFINDWNKSIFLSSSKQFYGRSLVDNLGLVMSYSNDISFEDVFVEQLKNIMRPDDLIIAISGSGNSKNVIKAVGYANDNDVETLALTGFDGGTLKKISKNNIWIPINDMQIVEDFHSIFGHIVMQSLCAYSKN